MYWYRLLHGFLAKLRPHLTPASMTRRVRVHWPVLVAAFVPAIVLGPLLARGFVLTYDMIFTPHPQFSIQGAAEGRALYSGLPLQAMLKLVSSVVPVDIMQKVILYGIFFLAIYTMYRCLPLSSRIARLTSGLFYAVNPFTYDRLMAGHWIFLVAYSLTPLVLGAFYRLLTVPDRRSYIQSVALWAAVALISPHHLLILGFLFVALAIGLVRSRRTLLYALATVGGVALLSSWWLLPVVVVPNFTHSFGLGDLNAFASKPDLQYGIWLTLLSLQGFWYTAWSSFKDIGAFWPVLVLVWLLPVWVGLGMVKTFSPVERRLLVSLMALSVLVVLFAAGPSAEFASLNAWLFLHVPGLSGLRESQKLLALLVLFYAVGVGYGIDSLCRVRRRYLQYVLAGITISLIVVVSWPMLWGAQGQLRVTRYPSGWESFYTFLQQQPSSERVLVLPYELYLDKTFAGRLIANPASAYFGSRAVTSEDPKLPGMQLYTTQESAQLHAALDHRDQAELSRVLRALNIRYIMFVNSRDTPDYDWVRTLPSRQILQTKELMIIALTLL